MAVVVHAADIQDRDGARLVLAKIKGCFPRLTQSPGRRHLPTVGSPKVGQSSSGAGCLRVVPKPEEEAVQGDR